MTTVTISYSPRESLKLTVHLTKKKLEFLFHRELLLFCFWCLFVLDDLCNEVVYFQPPVRFSERSGYQWCTSVCVPYTAKCIGEWAEARIVEQLQRSLCMVNHHGILGKLCSTGIEDFVLSIPIVLSNRSQYVTVDGCWSKQVNIMSGVRREVFWDSYCPCSTPRSFFPYWRISLSAMVIPIPPLL